jgi:hypothetical protein
VIWQMGFIARSYGAKSKLGEKLDSMNWRKIMRIADNVIREGLNNVYFISGTAFSGKTTIADYIADKYNMLVYHVDNHFGEYIAMSNSKNQPAFCKKFDSWEEYFNREPEVYSGWLKESIRETVDFAIVELLKLSQNHKVIVEGMFPVELMQKITHSNQCVFLIAEYDLLRNGFFDRKDKKDLYECIMAQKNPEKTLINVLDAVTYDYYDFLDRVKESGFSYFIRTKDTNHDILVNKVISALDLND